MNISLGKCWQSKHGSLVFQCSTHDGVRRQKGYLIFDPKKSIHPVQFMIEKPSEELHANGAAAVLRKYLSTGSWIGAAKNSPIQSEHFWIFTFHGKTSQDLPSEVELILSLQPDREIQIIHDHKSLCRLRESAMYTAAKPIAEMFTEATILMPDDFQTWIQQLVHVSTETEQPTSDSQPAVIHESMSAFQKQARDRIARRLKTLKKTLLQDQKKIPTSDLLTSLKQDADLLKSYLWLVKPDQFELKLDESQTGTVTRTILLNPDQSPGENLDHFFIKIKKMERAISMWEPRVQEMSEAISRMERSLDHLRNDGSRPDQDILKILQNLGLERSDPKSLTAKSKTSQSAKLIIPARRFQSIQGDPIFLGRTADESDQLVKRAKSQDWWIHVAGGSTGSHVIVPGNQFREGLPPPILKDAGILALHFSSRSESMEGEVYVARRHQIKKRKGMAAGLWQIDRAETALIRYTSDDLKAIFSRELRDGVQRHHAD